MSEHNNVHNMWNSIYRRGTNCNFDDDEDQLGTVHVEDDAVVTQSDPNKVVVTPPDYMVAAEIDAIVNPAVPSATPSTSTEGMASKVHLQAPRAKRYTPAAQQRNELTNTMIQMFQQEQKKLLEEDDELDLSFAAYAKRMRTFLDQNQREEVLQQIGQLINTAVNNVRSGMPVLQKNPQVFSRPCAATPIAMNVSSNMQNNPVPPLQQQNNPLMSQQMQVPNDQERQQQQQMMNPGGDNSSFYIPGPTSMNYEAGNSYNFQQL